MMMRSVWFYCSNSFWRRVSADEPCTVVGGLGDFVSRPCGSQQSEVPIRGRTGGPEVSECELRGVLSKDANSVTTAAFAFFCSLCWLAGELS